jgi:hypothetical protein
MVLMLLGIPARTMQSLKLMNLSFARTPMDSWTVDKHMHPSISRYSRFDAPVNSGVF